MRAGCLRHHITIERRVETQDDDGDPVVTWETFAANVPAEVMPMSAKELMAAQAMQSEQVARIKIRWMDGLDASMRITYDGKRYNIAGFVPDPRSGREWITIPVSEGMNDG